MKILKIDIIYHKINVVVVHNGIDFDIYKNDNPKYEGKIDKVVIISRLSDEKLNSIFEGIDIFSKILDRYQNVKLDIIGGGPEKSKVEEYLKSIGLDYKENEDLDSDAKVIFLGEQNDIIKYLKEADLLLGIDRVC